MVADLRLQVQGTRACIILQECLCSLPRGHTKRHAQTISCANYKKCSMACLVMRGDKDTLDQDNLGCGEMMPWVLNAARPSHGIDLGKGGWATP